MNKQDARILLPEVWGIYTQFTEVQVKAQVQLPPDHLIDFFSFCKTIAQAICPAGEQELKGIDCIVGKRITGNFRINVPVEGEDNGPVFAPMQCGHLSDDGRTLDQLPVDQSDTATSSTPNLPSDSELRSQMVELTLPYKLEGDERELMERLLVDLPALRYPMSQDEVENFMSAYFRMPNRPAWEPTLVTAKTIERRQMKQDNVVREHQKALQDELTRERISAVNANYVPVKRFVMGTYLPRDQAIAYLGRLGILHVDKVDVIHRDVQTEISEIHEESLEENNRAIGKPKLSDKQKKELVKLHHKLKKEKVKAHTKQVAEQFGISDRYVRDLVKMAGTDPDECSVTTIWNGTKEKRNR